MDDEKDIINVKIPLEDAVRICLGGNITSAIIKKLLRDQIIKFSGIDAFMEMQDTIYSEMTTKLTEQQSRIWELQEELRHSAIAAEYKLRKKASKKKKKEGDEDYEDEDEGL